MFYSLKQMKKPLLVYTAFRMPKYLREEADKLAKRRGHGNRTSILTEAIQFGFEIIKQADIYKDGLVIGKAKELRGK